MVIPFSIQYSKCINAKVSFDDFNKILNYIGDVLYDKSAEKVLIDKDQLTYKSGIHIGRWNFNILKSVEKGIFDLEFRENKCYLKYEFFMYQMLLISLVAGIVFGIVESDFKEFLIFFGILYGLNWIIAIIRHRLMFNEMVSDIEDMMIKKEARLNREQFIK